MFIVHRILNTILHVCHIPLLCTALLWLLSMLLPVFLILDYFYGCNEYTEAFVTRIDHIDIVSCKVVFHVPDRFESSVIIPCHTIFSRPKLVPIIFNHRDPHQCIQMSDDHNLHGVYNWQFEENVVMFHWYVMFTSLIAIFASMVHGFIAERIERNAIYTENYTYMVLTLRSHLYRDSHTP